MVLKSLSNAGPCDSHHFDHRVSKIRENPRRDSTPLDPTTMARKIQTVFARRLVHDIPSFAEGRTMRQVEHGPDDIDDCAMSIGWAINLVGVITWPGKDGPESCVLAPFVPAVNTP